MKEASIDDFDEAVGDLLPNLIGVPPELTCIDSGDFARICIDDVKCILRPTLHFRSHLQKSLSGQSSIRLSSDSYIMGEAQRRAVTVAGFLQRADSVLGRAIGRRCVIDELAGDSHMGGQRPLRISDGESTAVLKFAEPRAYQLLADVSRILARATGLIAPLPSIGRDHSNLRTGAEVMTSGLWIS
jgi:hypothetical protein